MAIATQSSTQPETKNSATSVDQGRPKFAYTISATATLISLSRSQVYVEIQTGRLTAIKVGGRTLIRHDDLLAWLRTRPRKSFFDTKGA